jgi:hypothetical protein
LWFAAHIPPPTSPSKYHKEDYVRPELEITDKQICIIRYYILTNMFLIGNKLEGIKLKVGKLGTL